MMILMSGGNHALLVSYLIICASYLYEPESYLCLIISFVTTNNSGHIYLQFAVMPLVPVPGHALFSTSKPSSVGDDETKASNTQNLTNRIVIKECL